MLASAGLDAFVFLRFFKMSIKLFAVMFFFAAAVLEPVNRRFATDEPKRKNNDEDTSYDPAMGYLWAYLIFTYFFTGLTCCFLDTETSKVIRVRQEYLGSQSTVTDRTFRITGIPKELRSEKKIKVLVEKLEIGQVESVTLCRDWKELDDLMAARQSLLRHLEASWSEYLQQRPVHRSANRTDASHAPRTSENGDGDGDGAGGVDEEAAETGPLLARSPNSQEVERVRPQTRLWYGPLGLQSRKTDALDYYEEKLRRTDEQIMMARKKEYEPADLAFVTMDSVAACQMAIQALIDPHPGRLLSKPAPAPSDIVWRNTYTSKRGRRARSWIVTTFVAILSVVWLVPVAFLASILSLCTIGKVFPGWAKSLEQNHPIIKALVQTGLPTGVVSLLNVAVPYLYDFLSYYQGRLSQGDIALSVISKNFFFTFFNIFVVFTVFGSASGIIPALRDNLRDTTWIATKLATEIQRLSVFYLNFIMLQGLGLHPFRLLEFGSVSLYPYYRLTSRTPRDLAEMTAPPIFNYGFYLPTALLVFILCLVYSALRGGYLVLFLGLVYFTLGYFTYKYQLLYAMDQPQHATGGAWLMICYRIILGLIVFQLTMSGVLALKFAFTEALLVVPLLMATAWYSYMFRAKFKALSRFIALRSIHREPGADDGDGENDLLSPHAADAQRRRRRLRRSSTLDEDKEKGLKFVNPSLVIPWVSSAPIAS